uniref:RNA helicase n=1 Tax=Panagrolaimus superbus TaxID=310955 RepID=A0A914YSE0_9BILA
MALDLELVEEVLSVAVEQGGFGSDSGRRGNATEGNFGGDNAEQGNHGNRDGEEQERTPMNYVPQARNVDDLFSEDQRAANDYADVVEHDDDVVIENFDGPVVRMQKWEEVELEPQLLTNIKERSKYGRPRKIQGATIPFILDKFDIKAQAETGSGKTAAFVVPIIDCCMRAKSGKGEELFESEMATPYAIIIGPTRELVMQVFEQAEKFAAGTGVSVAKAYGQYNIGRNHHEIRAGCDILVATPGRLKHFIKGGEIRVNKLKFLVLDEADRLLDDSFSLDIMEIVNVTGFPDKNNRQTLLFSATFPNQVMHAADQLLRPKAVFITNHRNNPNKRIKQDFVVSGGQGKLDKLTEILTAEAEKVGGSDKMRRTLVFVNTKRMSDMAALYLSQHDIPATSINGDRGQHLREQALAEFRSHKVAVLCATDVCARGIDVKELDHVINMEVPSDAITYVHRIGRCGRIAQGYSTTFIEGHEPVLNEIAAMMRESSEEIPEVLKSALDQNGGGAAAPAFGQSFAAPSNFANNVPSSGEAAAPSATEDW